LVEVKPVRDKRTRAVGWIESEIHEWVAKRIESSRSNITGQS